MTKIKCPWEACRHNQETICQKQSIELNIKNIYEIEGIDNGHLPLLDTQLMECLDFESEVVINARK